MAYDDIFRLHAAFLSEDHQTEHSDLVIFRADGEENAIVAAWRWVRNRQRDAGQFYGDIGALKVHRYDIYEPEMDGYIRTGGGFDFYEWKYDRGIPPLVSMDGWTIDPRVLQLIRGR
jgi:hypothetical protein